jgi:hypothetical protein
VTWHFTLQEERNGNETIHWFNERMIHHNRLLEQ